MACLTVACLNSSSGEGTVGGAGAASGAGFGGAQNSAGGAGAQNSLGGQDSRGSDGGGKDGRASVSVCALPVGMSAPTTIAATVALVNALPKPLQLSCFLETLPRPLGLYATRGVISAQPAVGERSPRMFLFSDPLILTIVPEGGGSHVLELGELQSETRSLKGEIEFPVLSPLSETAPFDYILFEFDENITNCAFCHAQEERVRVGNVDGFVSQALRPAPFERVSLGRVQSEVQSCDATIEPERCAILQAVFGHGDVIEREFPAAMATFY